jgi:glycosyltransferase involved in cell wall biosynthesis
VKKTIACVIPCRNASKTLNATLMSVVSQISLPDDVLILDDASTDDTLDIVARYQEQFPFIRLHRYPEKSVDWQQAANHNALTMTTADYVHGLSANDTIDPHFYAAAQQCTNEGVIFAEYYIRQPHEYHDNGLLKKEGGIIGHASCEMLPGQNVYPREVLLRQLCKPRFFEGGPVSLVRRDVLAWLIGKRHHELGTWSDSLGYSIAAWLFGAAYIPFPLGNFEYSPTGAGEAKKFDPRFALPQWRAACRFIESVGNAIPQELEYALKAKIYAALPREFRWMEMCATDLTYAQQTQEVAATVVSQALTGPSLSETASGVSAIGVTTIDPGIESMPLDAFASPDSSSSSENIASASEAVSMPPSGAATFVSDAERILENASSPG